MLTAEVSVVGLGKLGMCIAAVLADRGFRVVGVDIDKAKVEAVNSGRSLIPEPGLEDLIRKNSKNLKATTDHYDAVKQTQTTFIIVPTPSKPDGSFSLKFVLDALEKVGKAIADKDSYHLVVINSTVSPGSMENRIKPFLEEVTGKKCGTDFGLCYDPEFIALGDVIHGLLEPDFVLIGESDPQAGSILADMYKHICNNNPPIERTSFINAEIAKIAINSYVTMKITFANLLAEICENTVGADVDEVTRIIGRDSRIGSKYLKGGLGYGGPCFPRDNIAFARFAESVGVKAELPITVHRTNLSQVRRVIKIIEQLNLNTDTKIGILGLSYKPDTPIVEESQSIILAKELSSLGYVVHVYDPLALEEAREVLGDTVIYDKTLESCIKDVDVVVIATPWKLFKTIDMKGKIIIDCWRLLRDREDLKKGNRYIPLGAYPLKYT
ncbi:MAG: UDP-glucose dehydrogenase family protein [Acidilobaceae archaeon]|jgi:UDPglucose 6-dehydrogenase